jgi:uncharacterized DUF497 family protein
MSMSSPLVLPRAAAARRAHHIAKQSDPPSADGFGEHSVHAEITWTISLARPSLEASPEVCFLLATVDTASFWGHKNVVSIAFDPDKEARNLVKHGVSLVRAEEMDMAAAVVHEDDRFDYGETRYIAFGKIDNVLHCLVFTFRGPNVRAISLRKANRRESRRYGQKTKV